MASASWLSRRRCRDSRSSRPTGGAERRRPTPPEGNLRHRGDNDLYLLDRESGKEVRLTPHEPPGSFTGSLAPDSQAVYLSSNKDRDLLAFARVKLDAAAAGPIEVLAERADAELDDLALDHTGMKKRRASRRVRVVAKGTASERSTIECDPSWSWSRSSTSTSRHGHADAP